MPNDPVPASLGYRRPLPPPMPGASPPHPAPVVLLCIPGLMCWLLLGRLLFHLGLFEWISRPWLIWTWMLAVLTAIVSMGLYAQRKPKPWYVWLNLAINGAGLLFTLGVMVLGLLARWLW